MKGPVDSCATLREHLPMQQLRRIFAVTFTLFGVATALADQFPSGMTMVEVPTPKGFVRVSDEMPLVKRFMDQMVDPMNDTLAIYISVQVAPEALKGDMPELEKYFILKVNRNVRNKTVGAAEFLELKKSLKKQNRKFLEEAKKKMPGYFEKTAEGIHKEFQVKMDLEVASMVPFDPHKETDNSMAYSMLMGVGVTTEGGREVTTMACTATFVNPSGALLYLISYGRKDDLEWTRTSSENWAENILKGNPPAPATTRPGILDNAARTGLVGGIVGAAVALLARMVARKKKPLL